jgi:hypothetical protein
VSARLPLTLDPITLRIPLHFKIGVSYSSWEWTGQRDNFIFLKISVSLEANGFYGLKLSHSNVVRVGILFSGDSPSRFSFFCKRDVEVTAFQTLFFFHVLRNDIFRFFKSSFKDFLLLTIYSTVGVVEVLTLSG